MPYFNAARPLSDQERTRARALAAGDPLGAFTLEYEHFEDLTRFLVECAETWCAGRIVSALEGGYAPERLGIACVRHMAALE